MNILFLNANLKAGGAERQMVTVARLLKQRGHDVSFYCYGEGNFYEHLLEKDEIPVVWEYSFDSLIKRLWCTRRFIRKSSFDIVISFLLPVNFLNIFCGIGGKKWKVITGLRHCPAVRIKNHKERFYLWFQGFSDAIVSNSELARNRWMGNFKRNSDKLHVIYNHVKVNDINSNYTPKLDGRLHIVVAASYQYLKNPMGLVDALKQMSAEERNKIMINWYGGNTESEVYKETVCAIKESGLDGVIALHEATKGINDIMNQSDAVMLVSKEEGLPNAICEGMALGKPIIMTKVSDYDVLVDETNGVLCDWNQTETIKQAILTLANLSVEQLLEKGNNSLMKAQILFSGDSIADAWERIINK